MKTNEIIDQYHVTIEKEINDIKTLLSKYNTNNNPITTNNQENKVTSDKIRIKIQNIRHVIKSLKLEARTIKLKNKKDELNLKNKLKQDINVYEIEIDSLEKKALFSTGGATTSSMIQNNTHKVLSLSDEGIESDEGAIYEMKQIQSDTNTSLDNTIAMLQTTEDMGLTSLEALRSQGEQLEEISKDVDVLGGNVTKGNKALNRLRRWEFMGRFRDKK